MNLAIQVLTMLSGLLVNFLVPAVYGLADYGVFIKANILVFLFHKFADIASEPLIAEVESSHVFPVVAALYAIVMAIFILFGGFAPMGSPALLGAMLLSSAVLLSMYAAKWHRRILVYLAVFLATFTVLLGGNQFLGFSYSIEEILEWTNMVPAFAALLMLIFVSRLPALKELACVVGKVMKRLPRLISLTLVSNLLTNILPYLLSKTLPVRDLGLFRVIASLLQSATSLFPINTKAMLTSLTGTDNREPFFRVLLGFSWAYFSILGICLLLAASVEPRLQSYLPLVCSVPTLYWAVVTERFHLAANAASKVARVNGVVGLGICVGIYFTSTVAQATVLVAAGFSTYLCLLLVPERFGIPLFALLWVAGGSLFMSAVMPNASMLAAAYLGLSVWLAWRHFDLTSAAIHRLGGKA